MDEQSIFLEALEKSTPKELADWLDESCGTDWELRRRIERLLEHHQGNSSFLQHPADVMAATCLPSGEVDFSDSQASVLRSLGRRYGEVKGVALPDGHQAMDDPVVRMTTGQIPQTKPEGRYQFLGEIARGGMGAALKGRDTDLGRDLAVKVLLDSHKDKPDIVQRFVEEAQIGGQLQHPGIAPVYELGQFADQRPFFTMKLVKGKTLAALLSERESVDDYQAKLLGIFEQVCQTVAYAHNRKVIHRDLKPANIMVGAFGEVQVMDWGLAKVLQTGGIADETKAAQKHKDISIIETVRSSGSQTLDDGSVGSKTRFGSVMGTPAYMPPEQAQGETDSLDERADVFGLGAILCEILTGKPPYIAEEGHQLLRMAVRGDLDDCRNRIRDASVDGELKQLANDCLSADAQKRPRNAEVVSHRITNHLESVARRLRQADVRRKLTYVVAASLLVIVTGLGAGGFWAQAQETEFANQVASEQRLRAEAQEINNNKLKLALAGSHIENERMEEGGQLLDSIIGKGTDSQKFEWNFLKRLCNLRQDLGVTDWSDYVAKSQPLPDADWDYRTGSSISDDGNRLLHWTQKKESEKHILERYRTQNRTPPPGQMFAVSVFDAQSSKEVWSADYEGTRYGFILSPDGQEVAVLKANRPSDAPAVELQLIDLQSERSVRFEDPESNQSLNLGHALRSGFGYSGYAISPDGAYLALLTPWDRVPPRAQKEQSLPFDQWQYVPPQLVVWETHTGKVLYTKEFPGSVETNSLTISPDSTQMATVVRPDGESNRGSVTLWDVKTGDKQQVFSLEKNEYPGPVSFSEDGKMLAMSVTGLSNVRELRIWDVPNKEQIFSREVISRESYRFNSWSRTESGIIVGDQIGSPATFAPDNSFILDPGGTLFRIADGRKLGVLGGFNDLSKESVHFSADGRLLDVVTKPGRRLQWKIPHSEITRFDSGGPYFVSSNGQHYGWVGRGIHDADEQDRKYDTITVCDHFGQQVKMSQTDPNVSLMGFEETTTVSDDGRYFTMKICESPQGEFTSETPRTLAVWDISDSSQHTSLWVEDDFEEISQVRYVPTRGWLMAVIRRAEPNKPDIDQLVFWDVRTQKKLKSMNLPATSSIAFSPSGEEMAIEFAVNREQESSELLAIYSLDDLKVIGRCSIAPTSFGHKDAPSAAFRPESAEIAVMNPQKKTLDLWNWREGILRKSISDFDGDEAFAWTPEGNRLVAIRMQNDVGDAVLMVCDPENGERLLEHGTQSFARRGNSLSCMPGTSNFFSCGGHSVHYWDGTPERIDNE